MTATENELMGQWARAITRPMLTFLCMLALVIAVLEEIELPGWFVDLARLCIGWWFIERGVRHVVESKSKSNKAKD